VRIIKKEQATLGGEMLDKDGLLVSQAKCVGCFNIPCIEAEVGNRLIDVCPVGAISINPKDSTISISEACISCGLCAIRCPVGAITWTEQGVPSVISAPNESYGTAVSASEQRDWLQSLTLEQSNSTDSAEALSREIASKLTGQKASVIYPLVAGYFQALGFTASASNMGDTSSRADVTIFTDQGAVPIEVKSFTEIEFINLKSIQQALENKLLTARQGQESALNDLSSLALAFSYPRDRTQLIGLIDDIDRAFGIKIGIISLPKLIETAIKAACGVEKFDPKKIVNLKGIF
jgi:ferredoxin